eukprot:497403_1
MMAFSNFANRSSIQRFVSLSFRCCSNQIEEWTDIPGFSKYEVSSFGNVKNKKSNKLLKTNYPNMRRYNKHSKIFVPNDNGKYSTLLLSRTVLSAFNPIENSEKLFATHLDGNKYNNKLSNLKWNKCHKPNANINGRGNKTSMTLQSDRNDTRQFESIVCCKQYLESRDINISVVTISKLCANRKQKFGFKFLYCDESKYQDKIPNLEGESWKLFANRANTQYITRYLVSNKARIKSVRSNGRETLLKTHWNGGYLVLSGNIVAFGSHYIHKIIAMCWVPNPNNYSMVDHIDTNVENNHPSNLRWVANHAENSNNEISRLNKSIDIKVQQISLVDGTVIRTW